MCLVCLGTFFPCYTSIVKTLLSAPAYLVQRWATKARSVNGEWDGVKGSSLCFWNNCNFLRFQQFVWFYHSSLHFFSIFLKKSFVNFLFLVSFSLSPFHNCLTTPLHWLVVPLVDLSCLLTTGLHRIHEQPKKFWLPPKCSIFQYRVSFSFILFPHQVQLLLC